MTTNEFKRRIMVLYDNIDKKMLEEINRYGTTSLMSRGYKLAIIDVLMVIDSVMHGDW